MNIKWMHFAFALCLLALMEGLHADEDNFVLRRFPIEPAGSWAFHEDYADITKAYYRQSGVRFPEGSQFYFNTASGSIFHYNTEENQKKLGQLARPACNQVRIDALFVDFPIAEIERLARSNEQPLPRSEDILRVWREGGGTLLHAHKLITRSGANAQVETATYSLHAGEGSIRRSSANTSNAVPDHPPPTGAVESQMPEVVFNITPYRGPDVRTITLDVVLELATELEGTQTSVGSRTRRNRNRPSQPAFYSRNLVASLIVPDQSTHVFGGMINPNGDGLTYVLLTATQIDSLGRPLADYAGEAVEHAPHYMGVPVTNTGAELDE